MPEEMGNRLLKGSVSGSFRALSGLDQTDLIVSFRRLNGCPILVAVGLAARDVFAPFERNKRLYASAGILLSAAIIIAGIVIQRQQRSILYSRHALTVTLENMTQEIAMVSADGSVPVVNRRAIELLELPPQLMARHPTFQDILRMAVCQR